MNRNLDISARVVAGIAVCLALSISTSCYYFDPLNPFDRGTEHHTWEKYFGGWDNEIGYSVQQTADNGYIIAGYTGTFGGPEYLLLIKTDEFGNQQWSETFGGEGQNRGHCVRQTADGGYIITGTTDLYGGAGGNDVWLIKTLPNGTEEWSNTFGGSSDDEGWCVRQTPTDGGYIIAGTTSSFGAGAHDVYLIKTNASGTEEWSYPFGDIYSDRGYSVRQTGDGGYIIAGVTQATTPPYDDNAYLIKTDALGVEQWIKSFDAASDLDDGGTCAQRTTGGGYILVGYTQSNGAGDFDAWMIKTDSIGDEEWSQTFGGDSWDRAESIQQTSDGGYVIAGVTKSFGLEEQAWLIKTDFDGIEEWSETFGGDGNEGALHAEQISFGGNYIVTGYTNSFLGGPDVYLIHYVP